MQGVVKRGTFLLAFLSKISIASGLPTVDWSLHYLPYIYSCLVKHFSHTQFSIAMSSSTHASLLKDFPPSFSRVMSPLVFLPRKMEGFVCKVGYHWLVLDHKFEFVFATAYNLPFCGRCCVVVSEIS